MNVADAKARETARLAALKSEIARCYGENVGLRHFIGAVGRPGWMRSAWLVAIARAWSLVLRGPRRARRRRVLERTGLFDAAWYLEANPDVSKAGVDPLDHYLRHGANEGRRPNRYFIPEWYRLQCPHLAELNIEPLSHYVREGAGRGLSPHPEVLPAELLWRHPEARSYPTVLHFLLAEGLPSNRAPSAEAGPGEPARPSEKAAPAAAGRRVCAFSHFDAAGRILGYVRHYLDALARHGFEIHFISTAPRLDPEGRAQLEAAGVRTYLRDNRGRDFGSWQWGLREIPALAQADTLLLANDSVFGPLYDPAELFDAMRREQADVWGITDSSESGWHLQSYFLCFSRRARESQVFRDIFAQDFASLPDKRAIIDRGEIALSQALVRDGMTLRAYCPHERIAPMPSRGEPFNPTYSAWDALIVRQRCPFLKRELFLDDPGNGFEAANWRAVAEGRYIANWRAVVEGYTDYDSTLIDEYIAHAAGGRDVQPGAR